MKPQLPLIEQIEGELVEAAADFAEILGSVAQVRRYALATDGFGGHVESWVADPGTIPCRLDSSVPSQPRVVGQRFVNADDVIVVRYGIDVNLNLRDRLLVDAVTYEVQAISEIGDFGLYNDARSVVVDQPYTTVIGSDTTIQPVHALPQDSWDFFHVGAAAVATGTGHRRVNGNWNVQYVAVSADIPPGTGPTVFDVKRNGVTLFTTITKPTLAAGVSRMVTSTPDVFALSDGDDLTVDTLSIADTNNPGSDITVQVVVAPRL